MEMKDKKWPWKTMCLVSSVISKETGDVEQHFDVNVHGYPVGLENLEDMDKLANALSERVEFHLQYEDPFRDGRPHTIAILATCHSLTDVDTEIVDYVAHEPLRFKKRVTGYESLFEPCPRRDKFVRNLIELYPESCKRFTEKAVDDE